MATIENRSRTEVTVKKRDDLTRCFPHDKPEAAQRYVSELQAQNLQPLVRVLDEAYSVRYWVNGERKSFTAKSEAEALAIQKRIEADQHHGLFIDYTEAHRVTLADLLIRYAKEEAPRLKSFAVICYQINRWLEDAGLERLDVVAIHAAHPNPKDRNLEIPQPTGRRMSQPSDAVAFIRKAFAHIQPEDFREYSDERLQVVAPATVDREFDVFRAVCTTAIEAWRIYVHMHPMAGLERPKYFNERDRRLRDDEEARLMAAAYEEDLTRSSRAHADESFDEQKSDTKYQRLKALREARQKVDEDSSLHVPMLATFIQFLLMTGARRSEALKLTWDQIRWDDQAAFFPETKNGRPRAVPLRRELIEALQMLPRTSEQVFPFSGDYLRRAWTRMCEAAGIATTGDDRLRIHDLRHEAISRVAEAGSRTKGGFSLLDLQAFSGHRDPRMLLRYTHLTPGGLAKRLDAAFSEEGFKEGFAIAHRGRTRLTKKAELPMSDVLSTDLGCSREVGGSDSVISLAVLDVNAGNVINVDFKRKSKNNPDGKALA